MDPLGIVLWLLFGAIAGWLAGQIVKGYGFGLVGNVVVGIVGAVLGGWLFGALGIATGTGWVGSMVTAVVGAIVLLAAVGVMRKAAV